MFIWVGKVRKTPMSFFRARELLSFFSSPDHSDRLSCAKGGVQITRKLDDRTDFPERKQGLRCQNINPPCVLTDEVVFANASPELSLPSFAQAPRG